MLRGSGVSVDVRTARPYMAYREVPVNVQLRQEGDCFARYKVRMQEIYESIRLCRMAIDQLPAGAIAARVPIALRPPRGETYFAIENSRREYGFYLITDRNQHPSPSHMRPPSSYNFHILP